MKKTKKKILALALLATFVVFGGSNIHFFDTNTASAHTSMHNQSHDTGCNEINFECEKTHNENCEECVTNTHCHFDCLAEPDLTLILTEAQTILMPRNFEQTNSPNYPPEAPPS